MSGGKLNATIRGAKAEARRTEEEGAVVPNRKARRAMAKQAVARRGPKRRFRGEQVLQMRRGVAAALIPEETDNSVGTAPKRHPKEEEDAQDPRS